MSKDKQELYEYPFYWKGSDYFVVWLGISLTVALFCGSIAAAVIYEDSNHTRLLEQCIKHNIPLNECK